jgi:CheY-like chemotaxis protein
LHPQVKPGPYVLLSVSDTGCGMSEEVKAHVFEPFFTTKGPGKGTGLGLATVFAIVTQWQGHCEVETAVGRGSSFNIYLPAVEGCQLSGDSAHDGKIPPRGSETIMLVEDEDGVRGITRMILQGLNYTVLEARSGEEAIRLCETHTDPIHLLITDVVMPKMGGRQVAEHVSAARQGIKTMFISGYTDDAIIRHGIEQSKVAFLKKPFTHLSLANKVREVLDY